MRGRLIFPFFAEIAQLDTVETAADPDGAGPLTSGYDDDFRTVIHVPQAGGGGASARKEKPVILVPCQIEPIDFDKLQQFASGNIPERDVTLVFHFSDLEELGLVGSDGNALIRFGDRLSAIRQCPSAELVQEVTNPPGLFAVGIRPSGFGLSGGERNLLIVGFNDREQGLSQVVS